MLKNDGVTPSAATAPKRASVSGSVSGGARFSVQSWPGPNCLFSDQSPIRYGLVALTLDGSEHLLAGGDAANIPAGTAYATRVVSGAARSVASSAGGNGAAMWDHAGAETPEFSHPLEPDAHDRERVRTLTGVDVALT